jgi:hypothetical protein
MICRIANILRSNFMKTASKKLNKNKSFYSPISQKERGLIKHLLSPLELSALRHNYQPFNYKCEGNFIYISVPACKQLLTRAKTQLSFFTNRLQIERESQRVPRRLREVFEDPAEILSLPAYTRNHLCRLECYTMLRIMILGRKYFLERKEFGKKSMQIMDDLFKRYKCSHLFR